MALQQKITIDHDSIREWAGDRGGTPALLHAPAGEGVVLSIDFGDQAENMEEISWGAFFQIFDDNDLAFLYEDEAEDGSESYVYQLVERVDADLGEGSQDSIDAYFSEED